MSCLEVKNVSKSFSGIKAVQNVTLKAERGKSVPAAHFKISVFFRA